MKINPSDARRAFQGPTKVQLAFCLIVCAGLWSSANHLAAEESGSTAEVLTKQQWEDVDRSVERGLTWLAGQQQRDGSFPTRPHGQPGVTSLCVLAFLSHGHLPGEGPYGDQLEKAVDYIAGCQKKNGLLALTAPNGLKLSRNVNYMVGSTSGYNHALSALVLSEIYGLQGEQDDSQSRAAIRKALDATLEMQQWPKDLAVDRGGWRYVQDYDGDDSDLSITGWHLMFLRSAKNAGFDVPQKPIDEAVEYVRSCYRAESSTFVYTNGPGYIHYKSRGVTGAGILALAHAGAHNTPEAQASGDWLLKNPFDKYNFIVDPERYHYGLFTCTQAMYQLGGKHWRGFFPSAAVTVVASQSPDGSWQRESHKYDSQFGNAYTSAICLIALGTPNDLLPIFQR